MTMQRFFTSDHHFGHRNIIKYENRPFSSVEEMDEAMITRWNLRVNPYDTVFHLGDLSFYKKDQTAALWKRLNGVKVLILGNHDRKGTWYEQAGITVIKPCLQRIGDHDYFLCHNPEHATDQWRVMHGHVHGKSRHTAAWAQSCLHVGVDAWDFYPVSEHELIGVIKEAYQ